MTSDAAKLIAAWGDNAIAALPSVTDIPQWVVDNRYRLHDLEQLAPAKCAEVQAAIAQRCAAIDARRATIREGIG